MAGLDMMSNFLSLCILDGLWGLFFTRRSFKINKLFDTHMEVGLMLTRYGRLFLFCYNFGLSGLSHNDFPLVAMEINTIWCCLGSCGCFGHPTDFSSNFLFFLLHVFFDVESGLLIQPFVVIGDPPLRPQFICRPSLFVTVLGLSFRDLIGILLALAFWVFRVFRADDVRLIDNLTIIRRLFNLFFEEFIVIQDVLTRGVCWR